MPLLGWEGTCEGSSDRAGLRAFERKRRTCSQAARTSLQAPVALLQGVDPLLRVQALEIHAGGAQAAVTQLLPHQLDADPGQREFDRVGVAQTVRRQVLCD